MVMRILIPLLLLPIFAFAASQSDGTAASTINVLPLPASAQLQPGQLRLDVSFTISTEGHGDARLQRAILRLQQGLALRTGITLSLGIAPSGTPGMLKITVNESGAAYPKFGDDESYTLAIGSDGATLGAHTVWGAMHGMETLLQLVTGDSAGYYFPLVNIQDKPRFGWRGLMIDVGRHFEPVEVNATSTAWLQSR